MKRRTNTINTPGMTLQEQLYIALRRLREMHGIGDLSVPAEWDRMLRGAMDEEEAQIYGGVRDAMARAISEDDTIAKMEHGASYGDRGG